MRMKITAAANRIHPGKADRRWLFVLRTFWFHRPTRRWFRQIAETSWLRALFDKRPSLAERLHRPYQQSHLGIAERHRFLREHYDACGQVNWQPFCLRVADDEPLTLARITGRDGSEFLVFISMRGSAHKEGEWLVCLSGRGYGFCEYSVTLSLRRGEAGPILFIGGLQGPGGGAGRERVREMTRALQGARPRDLILEIARAIAAAAGCSAIEMVNSATHIYRNPRKRKTLFFDYDRFAQEEGATATARHSWLLPLARPVRDLQELPSKKRAQYARKQALIESVRSAVTATIRTTIHLQPEIPVAPVGTAGSAIAPDSATSEQAAGLILQALTAGQVPPSGNHPDGGTPI